MPSSPRSVNLGQRIALRRRHLGLSQAELADRLGLESPETVSRYERGEREPRFGTLQRLAAALELDVAALVQPPGESVAPPVVSDSTSAWKPEGSVGDTMNARWRSARNALLAILDDAASRDPVLAVAIAESVVALLLAAQRAGSSR